MARVIFSAFFGLWIGVILALVVMDCTAPTQVVRARVQATATAAAAALAIFEAKHGR